ncbi:hypothetical protein J6590_011219 [Homalodisca vitripennis]|nr:hypothetical protein J6590_011219 [Homalodisca vitripennis]
MYLSSGGRHRVSLREDDFQSRAVHNNAAISQEDNLLADTECRYVRTTFNHAPSTTTLPSVKKITVIARTLIVEEGTVLSGLYNRLRCTCLVVADTECRYVRTTFNHAPSTTTLPSVKKITVIARTLIVEEGTVLSGLYNRLRCTCLVLADTECRYVRTTFNHAPSTTTLPSVKKITVIARTLIVEEGTVLSGLYNRLRCTCLVLADTECRYVRTSFNHAPSTTRCRGGGHGFIGFIYVRLRCTCLVLADTECRYVRTSFNHAPSTTTLPSVKKITVIARTLIVEEGTVLSGLYNVRLRCTCLVVADTECRYVRTSFNHAPSTTTLPSVKKITVIARTLIVEEGTVLSGLYMSVEMYLSSGGRHRVSLREDDFQSRAVHNNAAISQEDNCNR